MKRCSTKDSRRNAIPSNSAPKRRKNSFKIGYRWEREVQKSRDCRGFCERTSRHQTADLVSFDFETGITQVIECKKTEKTKWCPNSREVLQFQRAWELHLKIHEANMGHAAQVVYELKEAGIKRVLGIEEVRRQYFPDLPE